MRTRSPRIAPPVKGLVGSTASTPMRAPAARKWRTSAAVSVDFPAPGAPVTPMVHARSAADTGSAVIAARASSPPVSTIERRRASAPRSPPRTSATNAADADRVTTLAQTSRSARPSECRLRPCSRAGTQRAEAGDGGMSGEGFVVDQGVVDDRGDAWGPIHDDALDAGLERLHRDRAGAAGTDQVHVDDTVVVEVVEHDVATVA